MESLTIILEIYKVVLSVITTFKSMIGQVDLGIIVTAIVGGLVAIKQINQQHKNKIN